jgi:mRNA-degrading endonuclease RelE of RelBE toxin-antitoxin system
MAYSIVYSPEAVDHLTYLSKAEQVKVLDEVDEQLANEPELLTRRRKLLRPNLLASWQLKLGDLRIFYEVQEEPTTIVAVSGG